MTIFTERDTETEAVGAALARALERDGVRRAFIAMRGEMGVGKTAFVRGFASYFGISGVKSPTYTVVNEYAGACRIFHFDMYRITDADDLYSIGYDDYVERDGYCIAEWSENIEDALPTDAIFVTISREGHECGRRIDISYDNVSL
ncbi:MAG: tRNA (adenosine(37)-N6)-threonylcarbamoyltransferase complex ATPase subunit type 1 TsaE [Clostridia bacterium]|nr:tRNA (adenosine(37)-N6)-threonylcarbamoyltransferase complex ATPase subunit type 1 TsaE [Clostridia bacterium]